MSSSLCLDDQLCFKLYALSRQVTSLYRPVLEKLDITYPQYLVMLVLWEEKRITVKALGNRLYLDSGTLTPLLKRLEQKGFLARQRDAADERSVIITLTAGGKALLPRAKNVPDTVAQCMGLTEQHYRALKQELDALLAKLPA